MASFLGERNMARVARDGELVDAIEHPAMLAWADGQLVWSLHPCGRRPQ